VARFTVRRLAATRKSDHVGGSFTLRGDGWLTVTGSWRTDRRMDDRWNVLTPGVADKGNAGRRISEREVVVSCQLIDKE
jgi:hypothetical protein